MRYSEFKPHVPVSEGINDPAIFKVLFVIGGPGSGKTYITNSLGLRSMGFVPINSDIAFEYLMRKHGIDSKMPEHERELREPIRQRAKEITANKSTLALDGRLGIIIDGTGDDYEKVVRLKENFDALGYNNFLIVVNTELEVARKRNQARDRTVPDDIVTQSWYDVQNNIGKFAQIFENIAIIDNSGTDPKSTQEQINTTYNKLIKFVGQAPNKPAAKEWIRNNKNSGLDETNHQLTELVDIDKSFPIDNWHYDDDSYTTIATAKDSQGEIIEILFTELHEKINAIDFDFTRGGTYEMTGGGDAGKVFATVLRAFKEYLEKRNKPDYIVFASKGDSRTSAYNALIKRFAGKFGYKQIPYSGLPQELLDMPQPPGEMFALSRI